MVPWSIKVNLNYPEWIILQRLVHRVIEISPVVEWEIESFVICEMYRRLILKFTLFEPRNGYVQLRLKYQEAYAVNNFFSSCSEVYNAFLRNKIEPHLPPAAHERPQIEVSYE